MTTATPTRAIFDRLPALADLVPFVALADGLPTPVHQVEDRLWVLRDDYTSSAYGGNKVRKLEFLLPVAERRGGPVVTAGGIGSHHVVAVATFAKRLGLRTEAVLYPQPVTEDVRHVQAQLRRLGVVATAATHRYYTPLVLTRRLAALAPERPYLILPGASTPLGALGYVSAGLELVHAFSGLGEREPDVVVAPLGSGGTAVGLAIGIALGGWRDTSVVGVRAGDAVIANRAVLGSLEAMTAALVALGGWRPRAARWTVDSRWVGRGYGYPTAEGRAAAAVASMWGIAVEPTYTAKACAAALDLAATGKRVVYIHTSAGANPQVSPRS
ncbi:MAG TPA: pyridoxal-phosphate dependent enzyme [Acidimicrobiales bacterium]|nr:pyridoxal-phosphate dependent enzyme [Acidimicrobiales bacterium]